VGVADTTTIDVRVEQKDTLDSLKNSEYEPYKAVLQRLIDAYEEDTNDE